MERVADSFVTSSDQSEISEFTRLSHARLACSYVSISSFCRSAASLKRLGMLTGPNAYYHIAIF